MPNHDGCIASQKFAKFVHGWVIRAVFNHRDAQAFEVLQEVGWVGQVDLCNYKNRLEAGVIGCSQVAVDKSCAWFRVGDGHDDCHLGSVSNDYALYLVGVIRASAKERGAWFDANDASQGSNGF